MGGRPSPAMTQKARAMSPRVVNLQGAWYYRAGNDLTIAAAALSTVRISDRHSTGCSPIRPPPMSTFTMPGSDATRHGRIASERISNRHSGSQRRGVSVQTGAIPGSGRQPCAYPARSMA